MLRVERHIASPHGVAPSVLARAARLSLPFEERSKSRLRARLGDGQEVAIFLTPGTVLRGDDLLVSDTGTLIRIEASDEEILEAKSATVNDLVRAAYHLGNRHVRVQVGPGFVRLELDPVLKAMLEGLGLDVAVVKAPFEPETGAYGGGHRHGHDESFEEDYALAKSAFEHHDRGASQAHADRDARVHHGEDTDRHGHAHPHVGGKSAAKVTDSE